MGYASVNPSSENLFLKVYTPMRLAMPMAILVLILLPLSALLGTPVASIRKIECRRAAWKLFRASEK
jgi:hypothetical protein